MATITSRPGGRRASSIAPAPSYSGVISKYSTEIASALAAENTNRINQLVLDWQKGILSWEGFSTKYQSEMDAQPEGSTLKIQMGGNLLNYQAEHKEDLVNQKRTELTAKYSADGSLSKQDEYNIEREILGLYEPGSEDYNKQLDGVTGLYDKAIDENIDNKRAELLDKYMGGGVSPSEQLAIVDELLNIAPKGTTAYNNLMGERAQIETNISNTANSGNTALASQAFEFAQYQESNNIEPNYQTGKMDGITADQNNLENWKNVQTLMEGLKGQVEGKTVAYVNSKVSDLEGQLANRQNGMIFDAYVTNNSGDQIIQPVNILDIAEGRDVGAVNKAITPNIDQKTGMVTDWQVLDPRTGDVRGKFASEAVARQYAEKNNIPGVINVKTKDGDVSYAYDKQNENFIKFDKNTGETLGLYVAIPSTAEQENTLRIPTGDEKPQSSFNKFTSSTAGKNFANSPTGMTATGLYNLYNVGKKALESTKLDENFAEKAKSAAQNALKYTPQGLAMSGLKGLLNFKGSSDNPAVSRNLFGGGNTPNTGNSSTFGGGASNFFSNMKNTISSGVNKAGNWFKGLFS